MRTDTRACTQATSPVRARSCLLHILRKCSILSEGTKAYERVRGKMQPPELGFSGTPHDRVTRNSWSPHSASLLRSKDTRKYHVLVGSLQVSDRPSSKTTTIPVSRIIPYPHLQGNTTSAIAVAKLAYPVSFTPVVLPICLPSSVVQLKNSTSCWVTGWGYSGMHQREGKWIF